MCVCVCVCVRARAIPYARLWCIGMRLHNCVVRANMWHSITLTQNENKIMNVLVVKVPSAGSPRVLPDIGDTTTV